VEIVEYGPEMAEDVAEAYSAGVRGVPHCYSATAEQLGASLAEAGENRREQRVLVARADGRVRGLSLACIAPQWPDAPQEDGQIRFIWYEPGRRAVGQALLEASEEHLRSQDMARFSAFHQNHRLSVYHRLHAYLSDHLGHVQALLGFNGYRKAGGEVYLDWPDYDPREPAPTEVDVEITVEFPKGRGLLPNITLKALRDGSQIGECVGYSCAHASPLEVEEDWWFCTLLGVDDAFQGKGLGKHILQRALKEMYGLGYRHAAISTSWDNYRALLFYTNVGYSVADWTYGFTRDAKPEGTNNR
jgi:GNAT superfamily N-acetyltransferase